MTELPDGRNGLTPAPASGIPGCLVRWLACALGPFVGWIAPQQQLLRDGMPSSSPSLRGAWMKRRWTLRSLASWASPWLSLRGLAEEEDARPTPTPRRPPILPCRDYLGEITARVNSAPVIADGDGKFTVRFLPRGLPGAGWDRRTSSRPRARPGRQGPALEMTGRRNRRFAPVRQNQGGEASPWSAWKRESPTLGLKPQRRRWSCSTAAAQDSGRAANCGSRAIC